MKNQESNPLKKIKDINQASFLKLKKLKLHRELEWEAEILPIGFSRTMAVPIS